MTGTMLDAGAKSHLGNGIRTGTNSEPSVPSPHFRCKPRLTLEVLLADGTSRSFPVDTRQCFIGSDEDCELQLVHPEMPAVVAVLRLLEDGVWIESCRKSLDLRINRVSLHQSWIKDGDEIEIAPFTLKAHLGLKGATSSVVPEDDRDLPSTKLGPVVWEQSELEQLSVGELSVGELSACELLDRIESDLDLIERDQNRRREGEDTLLRAIRARQAAMSIGRETTSCDDRVSSEEALPSARISIRLRAADEMPAETAEPRELIQNLGGLVGELTAALQKLNPAPKLSPAGAGADIESLLLKLQSLDKPSPTEPPRAIA